MYIYTLIIHTYLYTHTYIPTCMHTYISMYIFIKLITFNATNYCIILIVLLPIIVLILKYLLPLISIMLRVNVLKLRSLQFVYNVHWRSFYILWIIASSSRNKHFTSYADLFINVSMIHNYFIIPEWICSRQDKFLFFPNLLPNYEDRKRTWPLFLNPFCI